MKVLGIALAGLATLSSPEGCDLPCVMNKALLGDGPSALQMAEESKRFQTDEIVENWYRIAAENGSAQGQLAYAKLVISRSRHPQDCIRAEFWLKRASESGLTEATSLAQKLATARHQPKAFESGCKEAL